MNNAEIQKRQQEQQLEDAAGLKAGALPLPGPVFDAFAPLPSDIPAGPFNVRAFEDGDFEALQALENPVLRMVEMALFGTGVDMAGMSPAEMVEFEKSMVAEERRVLRAVSRGQAAWDICYVLTTPGEELDALMRSGGRAAVQAAAAKKFRRLGTIAITKVSAAAIEQMTRSWSTRVGFEPAGEPPKEGEAASSSSPP